MNNMLDKFMGQEVLVIETPYERAYYGKPYFITCYALDEKDTTIESLRKEIIAAGFEMRLFLPDSAGTIEVKNDRVNVTVIKQNSVFKIIGINFE